MPVVGHAVDYPPDHSPSLQAALIQARTVQRQNIARVLVAALAGNATETASFVCVWPWSLMTDTWCNRPLDIQWHP
jgi:hypothetical protein